MCARILAEVATKISLLTLLFLSFVADVFDHR